MIGNAERGFIDFFPGLVKSCFFIIYYFEGLELSVSFNLILCIRTELC